LNVAILGTGSVGRTLGRRWQQAGHQVTFGSRDPASEKSQQIVREVAPVATPQAAVAGAEVVLLATPWPAAEASIQAAGPLDGKVLIDATNPVNDTFSGLALGFDTSAAEEIARWAPQARVVKAFNTVGVKIMADPAFEPTRASMFYCGDDQQAKQTVHRLAEEIGIEPFDAGPLTSARYLEPFAMLYIHLAFKEGWGGDFAFQVMKRKK
jgi:8-hydroxy-5-deazaflavin:NADPH oxidoreductase